MAAASLVGGAALGVAFDSLFKLVTEATQKVTSFNSSLNNLQVTLSTLQPIFNDIEKLKRVLDRPQEETNMFANQLSKGEKLVGKCLKIKSWNIFKEYSYANKLDDLKRSLLEFFQVFAQADMIRDNKLTLVGVNDNRERLDEIKSILNNSAISSNGFPGCCNAPGVLDSVVGFDVPIEEVKHLLLKADEQVVVISAPGGCGKTTLAKEICSDVQIKDRYGDNIFFVIVSRTPNPRLIVQKVFQSKNLRVPHFQSDEDAIIQLENLLKSTCHGPVLLVLDDVWNGSESLIESFIFAKRGYKVLVTSRFEFPRFYSTYKLKLLNEKDAMILFRHSAFKNQTCNVRGDLVKKVVRGCGGFPLALKVIGRSLCGQPEVVWIQRIQKSSKTIFTTNSDILDCLQPSIHVLDEKLKACFLDLAAFPEDQKIPATALRDMWVELYEHDEDGIYTVNSLLELSTRNLVDLSLAREGACNIIDNCNEHIVMQHDLLRELAIYLCSQQTIDQRSRLILEIKGNDLPKWWTEQKQHPVHARLLSISTDETFSSKWHDIQLPAVEVLILNLRSSIYSLPAFIERMVHLRALIITNNGFCAAKLINLPFLGHLVNLKRIRLEYISFSSFYEPLLQLRNLQKISLVTCEIGKAFEKCTPLISNMWPNLEEINIEYCYDLVELPVALCDLIHLKKLCIAYCQELVELPEQIGNLTSLEVLRLHSCTTLSELPESIGRLHNLRILDISDCAGIDRLPVSIGELCALREIDMSGFWGLYELPLEVTNLVQLEVICNEETALLWESYRGYLSNLKIRVLKEDVNLRWLHKFQA